jgi:GntR family transcriptional regulator
VDPAANTPLHSQLKEQVKWLVALGDVKPGERLPTVSELADRLRINRNTVAQVYAELGQEGYLTARPRQGTFVADSDTVRRAIQTAALGRLIDAALGQAMAQGYTPQQFADAAVARAHVQAALSSRRSALFIECNDIEIESHGRTLRQETGIAIRGVHLDDVRRDPDQFRRDAKSVDLVITTLFHLTELQEILGADSEVLGLGAGPQMQLLRSLAQLPRGTTVAICCLDRAKATSVRSVVAQAGVQHLDLLAIGLDERERLARVLAETDIVYVSKLAYEEACKLVLDPTRLRMYQLDLDRAGIEMLKARLAEWPGRQAGRL